MAVIPSEWRMLSTCSFGVAVITANTSIQCRHHGKANETVRSVQSCRRPSQQQTRVNESYVYTGCAKNRPPTHSGNTRQIFSSPIFTILLPPERLFWNKLDENTCSLFALCLCLVSWAGEVWWRCSVKTEHITGILILSGTLSQWSSWNNGVVCSLFLAAKINRAAAFRTDCSRSSRCPGAPARTELQ